MADGASTLFGSTSEQGCVPQAIGPRVDEPQSSSSGEQGRAPQTVGPVYAEDGRLIIDESFSDMVDLADAIARAAASAYNLDPDQLVEAWMIWDCNLERWALPLALYRFEEVDYVMRSNFQGEGCIWLGAIDTHARVLPSRDPDDCEQKCWQWLRVPDELGTLLPTRCANPNW